MGSVSRITGCSTSQRETTSVSKSSGVGGVGADLWTNKWGKGLDRTTRSRIGNRHGKVASYSTIRRVLLGLDESVLAQALQSWVEEVLASAGQSTELVGLALDGKTLRGSGHDQADIAALQVLNAVVHSQPVPAQTNELGAMPDFLEQLLLKERVVTTDALHAQRDQAETILKKGDTIYCASSRTNLALSPL